MPEEKLPGRIVRKPAKLSRGRITIQLLGCYEFSDEDLPYLIEVLVTAPWYILEEGLENVQFYLTPGWDEPPARIHPQFILDRAGETLIGSYLHRLPALPPRRRTHEDYLKQSSTRFAALLPPEVYGHLLTPLGIIPLPDPEPIPERLLRLIWVES